MNHYPRHIGDFNNATRHLTRVERSLYSDCIDLYYDREAPLPTEFDKVARLVLARSDEEREALDIVLHEFFRLDEDGWHNARCDAEIARYRSQLEQASRAGKASAERRSTGRVSGAATSQQQDSTTVDFALNGNPTTVERPLDFRSTNQNQNQNQTKKPTPDGVGKENASGGFSATDQEKQENPEAAEQPSPAKTAKPLRGTRLPEDWQPDPDSAAQAAPGVDVAVELAKFRDHWRAKPGRDGCKLDWQATWRNWLRNARSTPVQRPFNGASTTVETPYQRSMRQRYEEATGKRAPVATTRDVIDITPTTTMLETAP